MKSSLLKDKEGLMLKEIKHLFAQTFCYVAFYLLTLSTVYAQEQSYLKKDLRIERGAYLVQGLGHCGACHTPRGIGMQEVAYNDSSPEYLSGAIIEGWLAPSLRTSTLSHHEIVSLLKQGISPSKGISGPMKEVITLSTQYATDEDLDSMAAYLVSIQIPISPPEANALAKQDPEGKFLYYTYCSACHGESGQGIAPAAPRLAGNSTVIAGDPRNLIHIIANGEQTPVTEAHPPYVMPAYKETLTEEQIVSIINYLRSSWGNQAKPITDTQYRSVLK